MQRKTTLIKGYTRTFSQVYVTTKTVKLSKVILPTRLKLPADKTELYATKQNSYKTTIMNTSIFSCDKIRVFWCTFLCTISFVEITSKHIICSAGHVLVTRFRVYFRCLIYSDQISFQLMPLSTL